ncbi:MAG: NUDIX domain-containing protein [Holophagaceae bacterium]|nr:NUDIX domain-containing protein [Holophagaceae bacterium]
MPPAEAPSIPWARIEQSVVAAHRGPNPHKLSLRIPEAERRAAVAMVLWGDAAGARKIVLVQRGFTAPQHPGELAFPGGMVESGDLDFRHTARRELYEELGVATDLWELGCFPDGVARRARGLPPCSSAGKRRSPPSPSTTAKCTTHGCCPSSPC